MIAVAQYHVFHLVYNGIHLRTACIMTGTDTIDIVLLHYHEVFLHIVDAHGASGYGICILCVDTSHQSALTVDKETAVGNY